MTLGLLTPAIARTYSKKVSAIEPNNLFAYYPLGRNGYDFSGNLRHGTVSGVTFDQTGIGSGSGYSGLWDGVNDYVSFGTTFLSNFPVEKGSLSLWFKVSGASIWTNSNYHRVFRITDSLNRDEIQVSKTFTNNTLTVRYKVNNTIYAYDITMSYTRWVHIGAYWDDASGGGVFQAFVDGVAAGTALTVAQDWTHALASNNSLIGSGRASPGLHVWDGYIAHVAIWNGVNLSAAQFADLAAVY